MCHLTKTEIQKLYRKFDYLSMQRFHYLLKQASHKSNFNIILKIKKICKHCQRHANTPHKFRFKLQNDIDFNYMLLINIIQLEEYEVLHIINKAIKFEAMRLI